MVHIEITENGKSILSYDADSVKIEEKRHTSALYRDKENTPFMIAPSAKIKMVITADTLSKPDYEIYTMDEPNI
jgi:hypothetical protein